jgi:hypothetical protein
MPPKNRQTKKKENHDNEQRQKRWGSGIKSQSCKLPQDNNTSITSCF